MDRRVVIGGGLVAVALVLLGVRLASNSGAKTGLDEALAHLPPGYTATHGAVTYSALTGQAHVRDLAIFHNGAPVFAAGEVSVSGIGAQDETGTPRRIGEIVMHDAVAGPYHHIARIDLSGLYPATLRAVLDARAYPGGRPGWTDKRMVLKHGEVHGVDGAQTAKASGSGQAVDIKFGVGALTMDGVRLAQLAAPPDLAAPPAVLAATVEARMSQESGTLRDVTFSAGGPTPVHGSLGRSTSGKFDGGRIAEFSLQDFTLGTDRPAGTLSLQGASGHGFDVSGMLAMMPVIAADPAKPHPEILNTMHLDYAELHGLRVDYPAGPLVTIGKMRLNTSVGSGDFAITGLTVKTSGRPVTQAVQQALSSFGMVDFTADLDEEGAYNRDAGQVTLKRYDIALHNLGTLHVTGNIAGVPAEQAATPEQMQQALASARLTDASIVWDDGSLTQRLLKMAAARQGVTPDQVRMGLAFPLASLAVLMPDQPDAVAQVNAFLTGQHRLAVTIKPSVPVGLAQWEATPVPQRAALLGVRVSGN